MGKKERKKEDAVHRELNKQLQNQKVGKAERTRAEGES